jgi:hypothetical protein
MKNFILAFTFLLILIISGATIVVVSPYYYYNKILNNDYDSKWYSLPEFKKSYLTPGGLIEGDSKELGNADLWQKFHFMDVVIPMPVKNPFFYVSPVLNYDEESKSTSFGLRLHSESNRDISKLYFLKNRLFPNVIKSQELFKLPIIKKELKSLVKTQLWKDIFTKKIDNWNIPFKDMIYNLYLIQLRAKVLPERYLSYSLVKGSSTAIIELESKNKDYITEMILTYSRGLIYSFILLTEKNNEESKLVRYKFLNEVKFRGGSDRLAKILYIEYKNLEYIEQIDHRGMLYLLSAWTHANDNKSFIIEMIENLEKGKGNQKQLEALYKFAIQKYDKTFTNRSIEDLDLTDDIKLKRDIELENRKEQKALLNKKIELEKPVELTEDQKLRILLKKAKQNKRKRKNSLIID